MDWFGEHFIQILIAVAAAIAAYINNRKKEKSGEPADFDGDGVPDNRPGQFNPTGMDMDEAERTRRVQEEIRRKIAERRAGGQERPTPPLMTPRPVAQPIPDVFRRQPEPPPAPPPLPSRSAAAQAERDEEVLARQRALEEQLRLLEAQRTEARRMANAAETAAAFSGAQSGTKLAASTIVGELRSPGGARRAIVLREVLGTPPGLR